MKKNLSGILLLVSITAIIIFFTFKPFLLNPNSFLFSKSGEAIKNYYNFSYQLKYGEGAKNNGTNYPYGENIQMDNSHPFHLWFFTVIDKVIPVSKHGAALINLSVLLSLFLALPFLFLILRRYKLPVWYSVAISLIILFLSPQLSKFKGPLELAYPFFIPMWWYFILMFRDGQKKWLWGILLSTTAVIAGFISQWHLAIFFLFITGIIIADFWVNRKNIAGQLIPGIELFMTALVPVVIVRLTLSINDVFAGRPQDPSGFFENNANIFSIFLPFDSLISTISKYGYSFLNIQPEGHANIGFGAIVVAAVIGSLVLYRFYTRKKISALFPNIEFNPYLLAATLLLLFSMNFPFNCGLGFVLDVFPVLKLFVAPGRIAWVFYYVFTVYAAIEINKYYTKLRNEGRKTRAVWTLSIVLVLWGYDAAANAVSSFSKIKNNNDRLESDGTEYMKRFERMGKSPSDFQAILSLPFTNSASDKMEFNRGSGALSEAMKLSYHSGLPIIESLSPRQPINQSISTIQLVADSCIRKTRLDDMNEKPILILTMNTGLTEQEKWIAERSDSLWGDQWITIRSINPTYFENSYNNWLSWARTNADMLTGQENMKADTALSTIFYLNFDNEKTKNTFTGSGALYCKKGKAEVFNKDFIKEGMTGEYELSFWLYFDTRSPGMPEITLNEIDKYNFPINPVKLNTKEENNFYNTWVRIDQKITLKQGMKYQLIAKGKHITIDNLLLKPVKSNVYMKTPDGKELMNNFIME